jgi:hypothetical protein
MTTDVLAKCYKTFFFVTHAAPKKVKSPLAGLIFKEKGESLSKELPCGAWDRIQNPSFSN